MFLYDGTAVKAVQGVNNQMPHLDVSLLPLHYSLWYSEAVTIRLPDEDWLKQLYKLRHMKYVTKVTTWNKLRRFSPWYGERIVYLVSYPTSKKQWFMEFITSHSLYEDRKDNALWIRPNRE